jgi:BetI-type transcriptional repressor, C-terminal
MRALLAPILTREEAYPLPVFVREITKIIILHGQRNGLDFGVAFLMGWSEAQSNAKVKELIGGGQIMVRETLTALVRKWQKRGDIPAKGKPENIAKALLSFFLGFVVQSAMIGGIDPDTAAKGIEGLISNHPHPRDHAKPAITRKT